MAGAADVVYILLSVAAGVALALQAAMNAALGKVFLSSFASVISFLTGLALLLVYWVIESRGFTEGLYCDSAKDVPLWAWWGGLFGAFYILTAILAVPR
jgi:bacterial/archaeal transporter family-2 protein